MRNEGYNLLRTDHPSNKKRQGVCMYFKKHIPIIKRDDLCTLKECLVTEILVGNLVLIFFFTISPNLIGNTGVDSSLFDKCHHSLIYGIIDFKVPLPPPYLREIWDYKNANSIYIQSAVSNTDWDFLFRGADVNKKVVMLNECFKNIFHNFIPNRITKMQ